MSPLKSRIIFWTRLISWLAVGCFTPICVFAYKFGLFTKPAVEYDELGNLISTPDISLNGWGIVSVLLLGSFITAIIKEVSDAYTGYSLTKQCYVGFVKTMPLIIGFVIFYFLNEAVDKIMFCLIVLILCRLVSIPLNPLPKWRFEKRGEENYDTLFELLTESVKTHWKRGD